MENKKNGQKVDETVISLFVMHTKELRRERGEEGLQMPWWWWWGLRLF